MDYDKELITDFLGEYSDAQFEAEKVLTIWDNSTHHNESLNTLFRVIHSIKGNFRMMYLPQLSETIHILEDLLSQLRDNKRQLIPGFTILVSAILEQCKGFSRCIFSGIDKSHETKTLTYVLVDLSQASDNDFAPALRYALQAIDQIGEYGDDYCSQRLYDFLQEEENKKLINPTPYIHNQTVKNQLEYFKELITQVESFVPFWINRSQRILALVSHMNAFLNHPVNPVQLEAAVYVHDIGMSFIPPQSLYTTTVLSEDNRKQMQSHCEQGYRLLEIISGWDDAALIIQQHHERFDGSGYPLGLSANEICDGAKLLAIADTYVSITAKKTQDDPQKLMMLAAMEIDEGSGHQFDPQWIKVFDQITETLDI